MVLDHLIYLLPAVGIFLSGVSTAFIAQELPDANIITWITGPFGVLVIGYFIVKWLIKRDREQRKENRELMKMLLDDRDKEIERLRDREKGDD